MLVTLALLQTAHATLYDVDVCVSLLVDYADADLDPDAGEDVYFTNADKKARGIRVEVTDTGTGTTVGQWTQWEGSEAGCTPVPFTLNSAVAYDIKLWSLAQVNGSTIRVRSDPDDTTPASHPGAYWGFGYVPLLGVTLDDWSPAGTGTLYVTPQNISGVWNVLGVTMFGLYRHSAGLANKTFDLFVAWDTSPCSGSSCTTGGDVYLSADSLDLRYLLHEVGHAVGYFRDETNDADASYDSDTWLCELYPNDSWEMQEIDFQSAAIVESFGNFFAIAAFNDLTESDCGMVYWKDQDFDFFPDFPDVGIDNAADSPNYRLSCEDGPSGFYTTVPTVWTEDYFGYLLAADPCGGGAPTEFNRATPLDWTRFWWDLATDEAGVSFLECVDAYDYANPHDWLPDSEVADDDNPFPRMAAAATSAGIYSEFENQLDNGVYR